MDMVRKDLEVTDPEQIFDILNRCDTMALAMNDENVPYVIPMTFGCSMEDGQITVYFHSAKGGHKWDILNKDPRVSMEAHLYYQVIQENGKPSAKYESVVGSGVAVKLEEKSEKTGAFKYILGHYKQSGFPSESCKGLTKCDMFKVVLTQVTGKHHL